MNDLYLVSPIPVSVNEYLKPHMIHKGRGMVVMYETAAAKAFRKYSEAVSYLREFITKTIHRFQLHGGFGLFQFPAKIFHLRVNEIQ